MQMFSCLHGRCSECCSGTLWLCVSAARGFSSGGEHSAWNQSQYLQLKVNLWVTSAFLLSLCSPRVRPAAVRLLVEILTQTGSRRAAESRCGLRNRAFPAEGKWNTVRCVRGGDTHRQTGFTTCDQRWWNICLIPHRTSPEKLLLSVRTIGTMKVKISRDWGQIKGFIVKNDHV